MPTGLNIQLQTTNFGTQQTVYVNNVLSGYFSGTDAQYKTQYGYSGQLFDFMQFITWPASEGQQFTRTYTLTNGNYVIAKATLFPNDGWYQFDLNFYNSSNQEIVDLRYSSNLPAERLVNFTLATVYLYESDSYPNSLGWAYVIRQNNYNIYGAAPVTPNTARKAAFDLWINGSIKPDYTWKSWAQLSGNNGMFLMDLSKIDDSIIGDGSTVYETFDNTKFTLNSLTDLYTMTINLLNSQETTIAYCGDNYLTATKRTTLVNDVTTVYVTLKFYFRSDVLIYTSPELTVYSSDGAVSRDYLSIMYDDENEVAAPNIIQLWTATGKYGINEYSLPSDEQMRALHIWLQDNGVERETISPYDIGTTDTGGDPNTPTPQDHITDSDLPTLSGLNLGVVTLYLPTTEQLQAIASFLWSDNVLDNFKKYFNNFADNLLNLFVLPYHPSGLLTRTFKVGNMDSEVTDVEYTTQRFYDVPMGSINIEKLWDSYLDFSPYTKIEIFLPYLGLHSLDIDEIMCPARMDGTLQRGLGSVLSVVYRIDVLTGVIVAKIKINGEIRYQFEGRVGANIPLTGQTYASMVQGIITAGAGLISTVATGGLTAPLSAAAAVTGTINASKPTVERIGNISGDASMLATDVPYVVITRPNKPMLEEQEKYTGFPSYKSGTLNNFSGLTICEDVHVEGISCTEEERNAIVDWLKNGVIL